MYDALFNRLLHRPKTAHKYDFGHVLVIGGSPGMVGAPYLNALAALRIGAGLVTIGSTPAVIDKLEKRVSEIMTLRLEPNDNSHIENFIKERKVNVAIYGNGLKPNDQNWLAALIKQGDMPLVIDGGGLSEFRSMPAHKRTVPLILTPHLGEFQRLVDEPLPKDPSKLETLARSYAERHQLILVLKGHPTLTIEPSGQLTINRTGGPALATAGSGDVLAGMIGGLIAQGIKPSEAASAAVYLHALCGDAAAQTKTEAGVIASDLIEQLPLVLKSKL